MNEKNKSYKSKQLIKQWNRERCVEHLVDLFYTMWWSRSINIVSKKRRKRNKSDPNSLKNSKQIQLNYSEKERQKAISLKGEIRMLKALLGK